MLALQKARFHAPRMLERFMVTAKDIDYLFHGLFGDD
jgi:hypothetical protein